MNQEWSVLEDRQKADAYKVIRSAPTGPRERWKTHKVSSRMTMSRGAILEFPGKGVGLTSAETYTVVHKDVASLPMWVVFAATLTLTNEIGRSMGCGNLEVSFITKFDRER